MDALRKRCGDQYISRAAALRGDTVDNMPLVAYNQENPGLAMIWKPFSRYFRTRLRRRKPAARGNPGTSYKPVNGYLPDEQTAISIAFAHGYPYMVKTDREADPYKAVLNDGVWTVDRNA